MAEAGVEWPVDDAQDHIVLGGPGPGLLPRQVLHLLSRDDSGGKVKDGLGCLASVVTEVVCAAGQGKVE